MRKKYQIYFRNDRGLIEACEDFRADGDQSAMVIGSWLFDACSDCCAEYDVWCGRMRISGGKQPMLARVPLTNRVRATLQKTTDAILNGRWKMARSQRLLVLVEQLKQSRERAGLNRWVRSRFLHGETQQIRNAACLE
jgi:hypothetical protein